MSFTLYALDKTWGPNPMKVGFFLEQLGLKYTLKTVTMNSTDKEKGVKGEDYLKLNLNGRTPTLVDHQNNDFTVWESGAILQYLGHKYDPTLQYVGKTVEEQAIVNQWLFFQATGHSPVQGNLFFSKVYWNSKYNEDAPANVVNRFRDETNRVLGVFEEQLKQQAAKHGADNAWIALDHPTVADFSAIPWLGILPKFCEKLGIELNNYPNLAKYVQKTMDLPCVKKVFTQVQH